MWRHETGNYRLFRKLLKKGDLQFVLFEKYYLNNHIKDGEVNRECSTRETQVKYVNVRRFGQETFREGTD